MTTKSGRESVATDSDANDINLADMRILGTYVTINGHEFVMYKEASEDHGLGSSWHALSYGENEIVSIHFWFLPGDTTMSEAEFRSDDQLFFQILSHLKLE